MLKGCFLTSTANMTKDQWLQARRQGIGGSDAAAVIGLTPWATPYTVYLDKLGLLPEKEDTEAMRLGRDLEDYVARRFTEATGLRVRRYQNLIKNPDYPFAHANIDRLVIGEDAGLECKTTSALNLRDFHGVEFPERYYAQCVHYLAVTGAQRWYLAVLVFGQGFFTYALDRDQAEIDALMALEQQFWEEYVLPENPPDISGLAPDARAVDALYPESVPDHVELYGLEEQLSIIARSDELIARAKADKDAAISQIKARMETADTGRCGAYSISWKSQTRRTLDLDALRADYPDIPYSQYQKETVSRPFRYRLTKEE